jgi:ABC-2 type transport system permease protein
MQFVDYPYLLDIRDDGLNASTRSPASLPQLTLGWASPISVQADDRVSVRPCWRVHRRLALRRPWT